MSVSIALRSSAPLGPPSIAGFEHVKRYVDPRNGRVVAKILPGEFYVTNDPDEVIATVLGSCVAACIWDPEAGIGGMNHFMLAARAGSSPAPDQDPASARYGIFAMEFLINTILAWGGRRSRLRVKLAGGGNVIASSTMIGTNNVRFARQYLEQEGLNLVSAHVEGTSARRLLFHPASGKARVMTMSESAEMPVARREQVYASTIEVAMPTGEVELFDEAGSGRER